MIKDRKQKGTLEVRYRLATTTDGPALAQLRWEFYIEDHEDPPAEDLTAFTQSFVSFWEHAIDERRWFAWVADMDGVIVANVWVFLIDKVPWPLPGGTSMGYLTNTYTVPEARNSGVGSELMRHVSVWAKDQRLELLIVWPSEQSAPFYERAGFELSDESMELRLSP